MSYYVAAALIETPVELSGPAWNAARGFGAERREFEQRTADVVLNGPQVTEFSSTVMDGTLSFHSTVE